MMQRTQIYLPTSQLKLLQKIANVQSTTVSELVRGSIKRCFVKPQPIQRHESLLEAGKRISSMWQGGPSDLASNLDEYLYGGKQ
ncbi:MAG: hypothetical protein WCW27_03740 [Patescibacteria group bacterium]|jgi:hypothetical protein